VFARHECGGLDGVDSLGLSVFAGREEKHLQIDTEKGNIGLLRLNEKGWEGY